MWEFLQEMVEKDWDMNAIDKEPGSAWDNARQAINGIETRVEDQYGNVISSRQTYEDPGDDPTKLDPRNLKKAWEDYKGIKDSNSNPTGDSSGGPAVEPDDDPTGNSAGDSSGESSDPTNDSAGEGVDPECTCTCTCPGCICHEDEEE